MTGRVTYQIRHSCMSCEWLLADSFSLMLRVPVFFAGLTDLTAVDVGVLSEATQCKYSQCHLVTVTIK